MARRTDLEDTTKRPSGRPRYEPSDLHRRIVYEMCAYGITHSDIGKVIGISTPLMRIYYGHEMDVAKVTVIQHVARSLVRKALDKKHPQSAQAAMFYLQTQGGWRKAAEAPPGKPDPGPGEIKETDPSAASRAYQRIMGEDKE